MSAVPEKVGWPPVIVAPLAGVDSVTDGAGATSVMANVTLVSVQARGYCYDGHGGSERDPLIRLPAAR